MVRLSWIAFGRLGSSVPRIDCALTGRNLAAASPALPRALTLGAISAGVIEAVRRVKESSSTSAAVSQARCSVPTDGLFVVGQPGGTVFEAHPLTCGEFVDENLIL